MKDCFMLGAHHGLELDDIDYVCEVLKSFDPKAHGKFASTLDVGACDL